MRKFCGGTEEISIGQEDAGNSASLSVTKSLAAGFSLIYH